MKFVSFINNGAQGYGLIEGHEIVDLSQLAGFPSSLRALIGLPDFEALAAKVSSQGTRIPQDSVEMLSPVPDPARIICIGLNYKTHIAEMKRDISEYPAIFTRFADSLVGAGTDILRPKVSDQFDYEGEFAFVIGKGGRHIAAADALEAIAGYTCFNDGSVRDFQRHTHQFGAGKNFHRSGSAGPWMITRDEVANVGEQTLTTRLNGAIMQQARLDDLLFGVPELVEYLSKIFPLLPGDIIATGTTGGVGAARTPPVWMQPGDEISVDITGIGTLVNRVGEEA